MITGISVVVQEYGISKMCSFYWATLYITFTLINYWWW